MQQSVLHASGNAAFSSTIQGVLFIVLPAANATGRLQRVYPGKALYREKQENYRQQ
jgi:hypothetical protein